MKREDLIKKYLEFFKEKGHKEVPNSSLVPENDPTVLFTTAGMHPLVPFLIGQKHPLGKKLVGIQRCIRTRDIDEVGDSTHHTFFEMLGNWSLGDYFKSEAIEYSFEFLTKILKIPIEKIAVSVFEGDKDSPKDLESARKWEDLGIPKERIASLPKKNNWWDPAGLTGPCGPDTEMFYWRVKEKTPKKFDPTNENWIEIWNDVLMQYTKNDEGNYMEAKQKNIDTGMGLERTIAVLNGLDDNYLSEIWQPLIKKIEKISGKEYSQNKKEMRIIADHLKASAFIISDGVLPNNTERGYVLRRLIRRAIRQIKNLSENKISIVEIIKPVFKIYPEYNLDEKLILKELKNEEAKFSLTLEKGLKKFEKFVENKNSFRVKINGKTKDGKTIKSILQDIGLFGSKSGNKFIPKQYLYSSLKSRKELLQGLSDTDGHINKCGLLEYSTISNQLFIDVLELLRGLGKMTYSCLLKRKERRNWEAHR